MELENYIQQHDAFVFELDDVIYPEKDFHLQVYYLFGQFMEYSEQLDGNAVLKFMQESYLKQGHDGIFDTTASHFGIAEKYRLNFDLLQRNIRLPLKLLLFDTCMKFMRDIIAAQKSLFLLVSGNPEAQLNKIKQVEWQGLEQHLTVYFKEEIEALDLGKGLDYLAARHDLLDKRFLIVDRNEPQNATSDNLNIKYLSATKLNSR